MRSRYLFPVPFAVLALWLAASAAAAGDPVAVVDRLNAALLTVMRNAETLGYEGRYRTLEPVLAETFDFPRMARISVGGTWSRLDGEQRERLIAGFTRLSIATFAARFDGYGGEVFEIGGEEPYVRGLVLVRNRLVGAAEGPVAIDYLLRKDAKDGTDWRIVDVFLDSTYSEMALKRSEYRAIIKREGFERLIAIMDEKIADLAKDVGG